MHTYQCSLSNKQPLLQQQAFAVPSRPSIPDSLKHFAGYRGFLDTLGSGTQGLLVQNKSLLMH